MTIREAIALVDEKKHNVYTREEKIRWLSEQDGEVWAFLGSFEEFEGPFRGYSDEDFPDGKLLLPLPFDRLYLHWLESRIDYANQEYTKFNHAMALHRAVWREFTAWCCRNYRPKGQRLRYF